MTGEKNERAPVPLLSSPTPLMRLLKAVWDADADAVRAALSIKGLTEENKAEALRESVRLDDYRDCARVLWGAADHRAAEPHTGATALHMAAQANCVEGLRLAMSDCDFEARRNPDGKTALMIASEEGFLDIARLLAPRSDPRAVDKNGRNALLLAFFKRDGEMCQILASQAACDALPGGGATSLHNAAMVGWADGVRILGAFVDAGPLDRQGRSVLWNAVASGRAPAAEAAWGIDKARRDPETAASIAIEANKLFLGAGNPAAEWLALRLPAQWQERVWLGCVKNAEFPAASAEEKEAASEKWLRKTWPRLAAAVDAARENRALKEVADAGRGSISCGFSTQEKRKPKAL